MSESNRQPIARKAVALPVELISRLFFFFQFVSLKPSVRSSIIPLLEEKVEYFLSFRINFSVAVELASTYYLSLDSARDINKSPSTSLSTFDIAQYLTTTRPASRE